MIGVGSAAGSSALPESSPSPRARRTDGEQHARAAQQPSRRSAAGGGAGHAARVGDTSGHGRVPGRRWDGHLDSAPVIRFEKVTKTYPGQAPAALDHVSVDVEKGEFVFLVGASGSGKSTFLRLVLREYRPTSGQVYVAGKEINRLASWKVPRLRRQIGTVFQDFRLLPNKTVTENVAFALQVIGKPRSADRRGSCPRPSSWSASRARATGCPTSCPVASSSGSRSPARSSTGR